MQLAPALVADPPARVEAQPEQRREIAGEDAEPGEERPVGHRERDQQAARARAQPRVAEQREAVDGDRDEGDQREVLVQAHQQLRPTPGRRSSFVDIVRPSSTATRISTSATMPEARLTSHQISGGSRVHQAARSGIGEDAARRVERPDLLDVAVVVDDQRRRAARARAARRPGRAAAPSSTSVSASSALGASAVTPTRPVQAGSPVAGSSRWWREPSVRVAPDADVEPRGRDAAAPTRTRADRLAGQRVLDLDLVGLELGADAADREVAAAVDDEARVAAQAVRDRVGAQPLAGAAGVDAHARRARDTTPAASSTAICAPARRRVRGAPAGARAPARAPRAAAPARRRRASAA